MKTSNMLKFSAIIEHFSLYCLHLPINSNFGYMKNILSVLIIVLLTKASIAQTNLKNSVPNALLIHANFTATFPMADLAKRFGYMNAVGAAFDYKYKYWLFGAESDFMFGGQIKELDVLRYLRTTNGTMITVNGELNDIPIFSRGWSVKANVGRIVPFKKPNKNSGLLFKLGFGYMQHKLIIDANKDRIPQLNAMYKKGYDRLCGGLNLSQFIGYLFLDNKKYINFYIGVELQEGFTKSLRPWQIDINAALPSNRLDMMFGLKAGWIIPVYAKEKVNKFYYN